MTETLERPRPDAVANQIDAALCALNDDALHVVVLCPKPEGHAGACGLLGRRRTPDHLIDPLIAMLAEHTIGCETIVGCAHLDAAEAITAPYKGLTP